MSMELVYYIDIHTSGVTNPSRLEQEIIDSGVAPNASVVVDGNDIIITCDSCNDEETLDTVLSDHESVNLDEYKHNKNVAIDYKSMVLIGGGFNFDGSHFSLSANAQLNWVGLKTMKDLMTWPVDISTYEDGQYELAEADLDTFVGTGVATVQAHLDSGRALKVSVNVATDKAGVDAVVDAR